MATQAQIARSKRTPKFSTRKVNRCWKCGRAHGYLRKYNMCRICFRELAERGEIPGITRSSW
jgi:small subunit ribosomal protein S14